MGRIVKRFFILPNAARSHDLIDIRLMKVTPGAAMPLAARRRRDTPGMSVKPQPIAHTESEETHGTTGTVEPPAAPATPATRTRPAPVEKPNTDRPKAWHVVLLDSDEHSYEYVIEMMMTIFRHPIEKAFHIASQVDKRGRAVCATTHRELAELRVEQVRGFGMDPRIASCKSAMRCYLEPAE